MVTDKLIFVIFTFVITVSVIASANGQVVDKNELFYPADGLFKSNADENTLKEYRMMLENDPDFAKAHWGIGKIFHRTGNFSEASKHYEKALSIEPDNLLFQSDMGNVLIRMHQLEEAEKMLLEVHLRNSTHFDATNGLAQIYSLKGNFEKESEFRYKVLEIEPSNIEALIGIANSLHGMRKFDEALNYYALALDNEPLNVDAINGNANSYFGLRQYEQAKKNYQETLKIDPDNVNALTGLANIEQTRTEFAYENSNYLAVNTINNFDYKNNFVFANLMTIVISFGAFGIILIILILFHKKPWHVIK